MISIFHYKQLATLCAALALCACSMPVQKVSVGQTLAAPATATARTLLFRKAADGIAKGEAVGKARFGFLCIPGKSLGWRDGRTNLNEDELEESFRNEVEKARFGTVVKLDEMVTGMSAPRADLMVSAQIAKVYVDACAPLSDFGNWRDTKGSAYVQVHWKVSRPSDWAVLFEVASEGSFVSDDAVNGGAPELIRAAFAVATQNLLADGGFYKTAYGDKGPALQAMAAIKPEPARVVEAAKLAKMPASKQALVESKDSVFTVIAGVNRGSGFVVAADGFLITSEKTVRGQQLIKIKSSSGRESLGFVVRRDELNDIALVRLTERDLPPLGVRVAPLVPADEVYTLEPPGSRQGAGTKRIGAVIPSENAAKMVRTSVQLAALDAGTPFFDKDGRVVGVAVLFASPEAGKAGGAGYVPITEALSRLALGFK